MFDAIAPVAQCARPVHEASYWIPYALSHLAIGLTYLVGFPLAWRKMLRTFTLQPDITDKLLAGFVISCGVSHLLVVGNLWFPSWGPELLWLWLTAVVSFAFVWWVKFQMAQRVRISIAMEELRKQFETGKL